MSKKNYHVAEAGSFGQLGGKENESGKMFLKEPLGLKGMEVSLNKLPAGASGSFYHAHKENEELYLFIKGKGQMQIDGDIFEVREGTAVRVSPAGERVLRSLDEELHYIVIQAREGSLRQWTKTDGAIPDKSVVWDA